MYNEDKTIAGAQHIMLEILLEIDKICRDNNLTYWLTAGTLLGAVRHKGFIPWDDDCDIAMPREDYNKFLEIAQRYLPQDMFLQHKGTEKDYYLNFAKVRKLGTTLIETGETGDENYCHGIFVDIFPYDKYRYTVLMKLKRWHDKTREIKNRYKKGTWGRRFAHIYLNLIMLVPLKLVQGLVGTLDKCGLLRRNDGEIFTYGMECGPISLTETKDILPVKMMKDAFEGHDFYVPNDAQRVLICNFGESYMQLPPVQHRKVHSKYIELS